MNLRASKQPATGPWECSQSSDTFSAELKQVLLTWGPTHLSQGEMPWRCEFGSALHLLPHSRWDHVAEQIVRTYIGEALARWLPQVRLQRFVAEQGDDCLVINLTLTSEGQYTHTLSFKLGGHFAAQH